MRTPVTTAIQLPNRTRPRFPIRPSRKLYLSPSQSHVTNAHVRMLLMLDKSGQMPVCLPSVASVASPTQARLPHRRHAYATSP
ncbi:hypothetical protein CMEL01_03814 [Colletotrichum melonis]|uniref:Uncharacterized protein n=1 Tax=Colletotrichum melonis TaxID=1209925 RepID=A0AAI9UFH0_9PEZI|nr:hypothetical protein CMEL01_03814 [Colletotrichum melonis]